MCCSAVCQPAGPPCWPGPVCGPRSYLVGTSFVPRSDLVKLAGLEHLFRNASRQAQHFRKVRCRFRDRAVLPGQAQERKETAQAKEKKSRWGLLLEVLPRHTFPSASYGVPLRFRPFKANMLTYCVPVGFTHRRPNKCSTTDFASQWDLLSFALTSLTS